MGQEDAPGVSDRSSRVKVRTLWWRRSVDIERGVYFLIFTVRSTACSLLAVLPVSLLREANLTESEKKKKKKHHEFKKEKRKKKKKNRFISSINPSSQTAYSIYPAAQQQQRQEQAAAHVSSCGSPDTIGPPGASQDRLSTICRVCLHRWISLWLDSGIGHLPAAQWTAPYFYFCEFRFAWLFFDVQNAVGGNCQSAQLSRSIYRPSETRQTSHFLFAFFLFPFCLYPPCL